MKTGKLAYAFFIGGFLIGILYLNIFAKSTAVSTGIFSDYFFEQYSGNKINTVEYIWYIFGIRVYPFLLLIILGLTRLKKISASVFVSCMGFFSGIILTTSILKFGIKGILFCVTGIMPHFICYVSAYVMLLIYHFTYPQVRWNYTKTISLIIFMLLGILSECYINPVLMEMILKIL